MADSPQIIRQWSILQTLSARRYGQSVKDLALEFRVNEKTVRRDLQTLVSLGFPIAEQTIQGKKFWSVDNSAGIVGLTLSLAEVLSLYVGRQLIEPLAGTLFWEGSSSAFRKIRATLGDSAIRYLEQLAAVLHFSQSGISNYGPRAKLIDSLMIAVEDRQITLLTYQSIRSTEPVSREVYPLGLAYHSGSLYLVAKATEEDEIRHYKVDRISAVDPQNLKFVQPDDFDLQQWMSAAFGVFRTQETPKLMVVRFDQSVARFVEEKRWHPSQRLTHNADGTLTAEFQLSDHQELSRWILSFGSAAKAIEPPELVNALKDEIQQLATAYETDVDPERKTKNF